MHLKESTNVTAADGISSLHSAFPVVSTDNTTTPADFKGLVFTYLAAFSYGLEFRC